MQRTGSIVGAILFIIAICGFMLAVFVVLFGDNIYQQVKGVSAFPTDISIPAHTAKPTAQEIDPTTIDIRGEVWSKSFDESHRYEQYAISSKDFVDFSLAADVQIEGDSSEFHGLMFRQQDSNNFYSFRINQDGEYAFDLWRSDDDTSFERLLGPTESSAILSEPQAINYLKVIGNEDNFDFFINGTFLGSISDSTFAIGEAGFVTCTCDGGDNAMATFLNATLTNE